MNSELQCPLDFDAKPVRLKLEFGFDRIGQLHQERSIRLINEGNKPIRIMDVQLESNAGSGAAFVYDFDQPVSLVRRGRNEYKLNISFRPTRRGRNVDVLRVRGDNKGVMQDVAYIRLEGRGLPVSRGEIYLCNVNLPFMFPRDRKDQLTIVLGHHFHVVVSSDEANHADGVNHFTAVPIRDERAGQEWRTSWGLIPLEAGDAVLSPGWIQGFQLFTLPSSYPVLRYPWGKLRREKLQAVRDAQQDLFSDRDPYTAAEGPLHEHGRHKPIWPHTERLELNRWDTVLVRLERLTEDGRVDTRPYIVISHSTINNRWERNIVTFLPTRPATEAVDTEKGFLVWTDESELGCPGEWLVMCNEPRTMDASFVYRPRSDIPQELRGQSVIKERLVPQWRKGTQSKIEETLATYLGLR